MWSPQYRVYPLMSIHYSLRMHCTGSNITPPTADESVWTATMPLLSPHQCCSEKHTFFRMLEYAIPFFSFSDESTLEVKRKWCRLGSTLMKEAVASMGDCFSLTEQEVNSFYRVYYETLLIAFFFLICDNGTNPQSSTYIKRVTSLSLTNLYRMNIIVEIRG